MATLNHQTPGPGAILRRQRQEIGLSRAAVAAAARVDESVLELVELGLRHPGDVWVSHVGRVLSALASKAGAVR